MLVLLYREMYREPNNAFTSKVVNTGNTKSREDKGGTYMITVAFVLLIFQKYPYYSKALWISSHRFIKYCYI